MTMEEAKGAETTTATAKADQDPKWKSLTINTTFHVAGPGPIWIVKRGGHYLRLFGARGMIGVAERRLATRFDSATWAQTLASQIEGAKVLRLWTKSEREIAKARAQTFTWGASTVLKDMFAVATPPTPKDDAEPEADVPKAAP